MCLRATFGCLVTCTNALAGLRECQFWGLMYWCLPRRVRIDFCEAY